MTSTLTHSEKLLLQQVAEGSEKAFANLYVQYHTPLTGFIKLILKSDQLADDVSQEVFIKIWENRDRLAGVESFSNYLFIMARNHSLNVLRKAANETAAKGAIINRIPTTTNNVQEKLILEGYWDFIQSVLNTLPAQTREVFTLCRLEHKTHDEIAELLGITRDAVKRHMMKSNKAFKDSVDKELGIKLTLLYLLFSGNA